MEAPVGLPIYRELITKRTSVGVNIGNGAGHLSELFRKRNQALGAPSKDTVPFSLEKKERTTEPICQHGAPEGRGVRRNSAGVQA